MRHPAERTDRHGRRAQLLGLRLEHDQERQLLPLHELREYERVQLGTVHHRDLLLVVSGRLPVVRSSVPLSDYQCTVGLGCPSINSQGMRPGDDHICAIDSF